MKLRKAINSKCKECIYDPGQKGSWRGQVAQCTSKNCPLYPVRPKTTGNKRAQTIVGSGIRIQPICPNPVQHD